MSDVIPASDMMAHQMVEHAVMRGEIIDDRGRRGTLLRWAKNSDGPNSVKVCYDERFYRTMGKDQIRAVIPRKTARIRVVIDIDAYEPVDLNEILDPGSREDEPVTRRDVIRHDLHYALVNDPALTALGQVTALKVQAPALKDRTS